MSWGERSCSVENCKIATFNKCHVDCQQYKWDGETRPDSIPRNLATKQQPEKIIKVGRNDPCQCRSGVKYKKCCGR